MDPTPSAAATTGRGDPQGLLTLAAVGGAFALGVVRLAGLVHDTAVNLPFQDQWDLLRPLFDEAGPWACFRLQHGPHRQGLGGLINWFLYRGTGWDVRAEAWAAVVVLTLAAAAALLLARRLRGRTSWTDAAFPLLLLAPVNWETMLLTPNLAHGILPLLLTVCLALAWTIREGRIRVACLAVLGFLALFTGFAVCAFLVSGALVVLRAARPGPDEARSPFVRWLGLAAAAVAILLFARGYVWSPAVPNWRFPVAQSLDYPRFLALMYASLAGWREISAASLAIGGVMFAAVLAAFVAGVRGIWRDRLSPRGAAVVVLTGTSLVFGAFTAIGRLPAGIEAAFMWRYLPLLLPAVVGVMLAVDRRVAALAPAARALAGVALVAPALVVWGNFTPDRYAAIIAGGKRQWIEAYRATHDLAAANARSDFFVSRAGAESPVIAARLRWLEERKLTFFKDAPPP